MSRFSKTQIDKLGERLRAGAPSLDDLGMLDAYRREFAPVYETTLSRLQQGGIVGEISGRAAKTTASVVQKLRRQKTQHVRLSQVQDICGLRVVVSDIDTQNDVVRRLANIFPGSIVEDRRENPSHGYRAVHVIVAISELQAEIQIRTVFQHMWAQFCENLANKLGIEVKYGGHASAQRLLDTLSDAIRSFEEAEDSNFVRESPYSDPLVREGFIQEFRGLIRFVEHGPRTGSKEADDVLPY